MWSGRPTYLLLDAERGVVVHAERVVDEDVRQVRAARYSRPLAQTPGRTTRLLHDLLVDVAPDRSRAWPCRSRPAPCRAAASTSGIRDAEVGVATGRPDDPAVDDLRQEAEAVRPVRAPAVDDQAEVVGLRVSRACRRTACEVVALRVGLERQLDADLGQRLLQRLGGRLLLRPLGPVGDVGREAVRLAAGVQRRLGLVEVTVVVGVGRVEVELLRSPGSAAAAGWWRCRHRRGPPYALW